MFDLTFFCSPIGLGHATRDEAITRYFQNISTKFVTGNAAAKYFEECGFDVFDVYTPPKFNVQYGLLRSPLKWLWNYYRYYKDCKKISAKIIKNEKPRLVVSDEDFASLFVAQENNLPTVLITDILETHFIRGFGSIIERKMNSSMKDIMKKCDAIILPENGPDQDNIKRVGPIVRETKFSRDELRKTFTFDKKTIVVSIGGTDGGKFLIEKTVEAVSKIKNDVELVIVSGPSLNKDYGKNTRNLGFVNNLHEIIYAADLLIALAGKSTIDEANTYGTPGIFIPIKDHFEQEENAKDEGFSYNDVFKLDSLIPQKLTERRNAINSGGAKKAYEIIKNYLN